MFYYLNGIMYVPKRPWQPWKLLWLKGCYVLREALGIFDCWIFEIRLLYSRCLHPAQPQGTDLCRYLGIQAGAELDLCPNTASSSSAAQQGKTSSNHFLLTAQCGNLGLKMHNWVKAWCPQTRQSSRGASSGCLGLNLWFPVPRAAPLLKVMGKTPSKMHEKAWECKKSFSSGYELKAELKTEQADNVHGSSSLVSSNREKSLRFNPESG